MGPTGSVRAWGSAAYGGELFEELKDVQQVGKGWSLGVFLILFLVFPKGEVILCFSLKLEFLLFFVVWFPRSVHHFFSQS